MERSREAISTIKGYYFQFDFFILQLLQLQSDDGYVQIEGIEDVDVARASNDIEAVQCKYYEGVTCTPSVIGKAIRPMLRHFAKFKDGDGGNDIRYCYRLFGYYKSGQDSVEKHLTVEYVKRKFFTYSEDGKKRKLHIELKLSDSDLENFLQRLELDLYATTYDEQIEKIIKQLQKVFRCTEYEARYFYYTNALSFVKRISVEKNSLSRRVSKKKFLKEICTKQCLFDTWYIEHVGFEKFYKDTRKEFFSKLNVQYAHRIFLIECDDVINDVELVELLMKISENWSKLSRRVIKTFCPYVHIYGISATRLSRIKEILLENDFHVWDGYEYKDANFSPSSLTRQVNSYTGVKLKMINEFSQIDTVFNVCNGMKVIYQFYLNKPFYENNMAIGKSFLVRSTLDVGKIV